MDRVVIESPYAGDVAANVTYAKRCVLDCLERGEAPYASHLFFTQEGLLDDGDPKQRALGIEAGLAWGDSAGTVALYLDRGVSDGMRLGIRRAFDDKRARIIHRVLLRSLDTKLEINVDHLSRGSRDERADYVIAQAEAFAGVLLQLRSSRSAR